MRKEDATLVFVIAVLLLFIICIITAVIGYYATAGLKTEGLETESHWYRCDAALCRQEKENHCTEYVKMSCEVCCEK